MAEDLDGRVHEAGLHVDGPAMGGILHHRAVNQPGRGVGRLARETLPPPFIFRVSGQFTAIPLCLHDMDAPRAEEQVVNLGGPAVTCRQYGVVQHGQAAPIEHMGYGALSFLALDSGAKGPPDLRLTGRQAAAAGRLHAMTSKSYHAVSPCSSMAR